MNRVVIVGASAAGLSAAETLRREGFGGTLTVIGEETHLPYDRPPLSKQILSSAWDVDRLALRTPDQLAASGLDLRLGVPAAGLDTAARVVHLADGTEVPYDGLIIATGVRPRQLPARRDDLRLPARQDDPRLAPARDADPGPATSGGHVLRTVDDALELRKRLLPGTRVAIVGAGFLGAECAAVARGIGCEVVLVEPAPVPLAHAVGESIGRFLSDVHRSHGVDLRTGVMIDSLDESPLTSADVVLVAIGSQPNTEWLAGSGLAVQDGVVCDSYCAAGPGIYAAGDVARWHNPLFGVDMRIEHRTNAAEQGMAAARNLLFPDARKPFAPVPYFWSDQYDLKIHAYGYLRGHDSVEVNEGSLDERRFLATYRRAGRLVGALAVNMPPKAIRPWRQAIALGGEAP